jgi:hypothetical protein
MKFVGLAVTGRANYPNWTASIVIGIEPKSGQNGGSACVLPDLLHHAA